MALTDASFLLVLLLAIGQGQRFLERPRPVRALVFGLCVGAAQLFKYNGWIAGVVVALAATLGQFARPKRPRTILGGGHPEGRAAADWRDPSGACLSAGWDPPQADRGATLRVPASRNHDTPFSRRSARLVFAPWGWGLVAILAAAAVYWPWFQFVEAHGGYHALLAHQRGYMNGISKWLDHWLLQLAQARVLSAGLRWRTLIGIAAALAFLAVTRDARNPRTNFRVRIIEAFGLASLSVTPNVEWWMPLGWIAVTLVLLARSTSSAMLVLAVAWLVFAIMTPFYHPYARLWLPLHALGWIVMGGVFVAAQTWLEVVEVASAQQRKPPLNPRLGFIAFCALALAVTLVTWVRSKTERTPSLLEPTDSLRAACRDVARDLSPDVRQLRLFCRPAVTYYAFFGDRVRLQIEPSLDRLLEPARPGTWCLLDTALTRAEQMPVQGLSGLSRHWVPARDFPTSLSLPTLLDVDPVSCYEGNFDRSAPLVLLRPRRPEEIR
jgi:hypothetical protein